MALRTRVKICGITRIEDALAAARSGADAVGFVFDPASARVIAPAAAREIRLALPPFVTVVGLFVDAPAERVREVLGAVALDLLQFHGSEPPEFCRSFHRPYIKAIRMRPETDLHAEERRYRDAAGILLDTYSPAAAGGTGERFDWARVPEDLARPVILAGGLDPSNVIEAVRRVRPYAVDVSSGVEQSKGIKDAARITAFLRAVGQAQA
jgi:phosphoribosylanthranilate isomerase